MRDSLNIFVLLQALVAEHEIQNISCAAQDPDDLCTFAYITKDLKSGFHFCHVFTTVEVVGFLLSALLLGNQSGLGNGFDKVNMKSKWTPFSLSDL